MATFKIILNFITRDRHLDMNWNHPLATRRIAVNVVHGFPCAVWQRSNALTHRTFNIVLNFIHALNHLIATIFAHEAKYFTLRHLCSLCLRVNVTDDGRRIAGVRGNQVSHVLAKVTSPEQTNRCDADSFTEHVFGGYVKRTRYRATQIRPVAVGLRKANQYIFIENGPH